MIIDVLNSINPSWYIYFIFIFIFLTIEYLYLFEKTSKYGIKDFGYYGFKIMVIVGGTIIGLAISSIIIFALAIIDLSLESIKKSLIQIPWVYFQNFFIALTIIIIFIVINVQIRKFLDKRGEKNGKKRNKK